MSWFGWFGTKPAETVLPLSGPPSPSGGHPLTAVVVKNNTPTITTGATAPAMPPSTIPGSELSKGVLPTRNSTARRGDYVALGGSRKSGKGRKGKKSRKSKSKSKSKKSKSRK